MFCHSKEIKTSERRQVQSGTVIGSANNRATRATVAEAVAHEPAKTENKKTVGYFAVFLQKKRSTNHTIEISTPVSRYPYSRESGLVVERME